MELHILIRNVLIRDGVPARPATSCERGAPLLLPVVAA
jgi:hypothetical protein